MTDIVERLRIKADMILMCEKIKFGSDAAVMQDAAVEIERLRETNEMMLTDIRRTDVDMLAFKVEIERLRAALEDVLSHTSYGDIPVTIYDNARAALAEEKPNE